MPPQSLGFMRAEIIFIILGTVFVFFGLASLAIAALRQRSENRVLIWLGLWSATYGISMLSRTEILIAVLPNSLQVTGPFVMNASRYLLLVFALLAWSELSLGGARRFTQILLIPTSAVAVAGIVLFSVTGSGDSINPWNNLLAVCGLGGLSTVILIPRLSARYLTFQNRTLAIATLAMASDAFYRNITGAFHLRALALPLVDEFAFGAFLFSFAFVAGQKVFASERRLVSLESELDIARQIQASILPDAAPHIEKMQIAASYRPMTAVGGDFYDFIEIDKQHIGFLIADVSGHGIPAALIASMIKVAMQSAANCAQDPAELLRTLNRILRPQLRGQLVSAAYLWIDMKLAQATYSAAGHPPLLCWRDGVMQRIESNGLLLGVLPDPAYPVCQIQLHSGDRLLLYTDGVTEPENAAGESFGDRRLEEVIRRHQSLPPGALSDSLLNAIARWLPASVTQQDDITLVVIDIAPEPMPAKPTLRVAEPDMASVVR